MTAGQLIDYLNDNFEPDDTILGIGDGGKFGKMLFNKWNFKENYFYETQKKYTNDEWLDMCDAVNSTLGKDVEKRCNQAIAHIDAQQRTNKGEGLSDLKEILEHHNLSSLRGSFWRSKKK